MSMTLNSRLGSVSRPSGGMTPSVVVGMSPMPRIHSMIRSGEPSAEAPRPERRIDEWGYFFVLPVLLLEFLAVALTRAVLPSILLDAFGEKVYIVLGAADCVRGLLAFVACPVFGKISDTVGRRICLFVTVLGTCAPVCSLAFFRWEAPLSMEDSVQSIPTMEDEEGLSDAWTMLVGSDQVSHSEHKLHPRAITTFVVLLALSGFFSSTFTLVFAYISDTVRSQEERVSAYGLALATFGLSFTIGPMAGGYLAQSHKQYVFVASLALTVLDLLYIHFILPESKELEHSLSARETFSVISLDHTFTWNPIETLRIISVDAFLRQVSKVAFLYYTGLWAIISTLSVYAVKRFHLSPERLGELMSALGLSTMVAEAVLVRLLVPLLGEKRSMRIGLVSFCLQCVVLGFAYEGWHLFVCAGFSLLGNLVYPSLSSLVSGSVEPDAVGEALGAVNGVKAVTEGFGPLVFGSLMTISEHSALPGWPYLIAALLAALAYRATNELPDGDDEEYIHELELKSRVSETDTDATSSRLLPNMLWSSPQPARKSRRPSIDSELEGLLSEVDTDDDNEDEYSQHD